MSKGVYRNPERDWERQIIPGEFDDEVWALAVIFHQQLADNSFNTQNSVTRLLARMIIEARKTRK